jgi:hypothetical protein
MKRSENRECLPGFRCAIPRRVTNRPFLIPSPPPSPWGEGDKDSASPGAPLRGGAPFPLPLAPGTRGDLKEAIYDRGQYTSGLRVLGTGPSTALRANARCRTSSTLGYAAAAKRLTSKTRSTCRRTPVLASADLICVRMVFSVTWNRAAAAFGVSPRERAATSRDSAAVKR